MGPSEAIQRSRLEGNAMNIRVVLLCSAMILSATASVRADDDEQSKPKAERGYLGVGVEALDEEKIADVTQKTKAMLKQFGDKVPKAKREEAEKRLASLRPGLTISAIKSGGPADKGGLTFADTIVAVGKVTVEDGLTELSGAIKKSKVGKKLKIKYLRISSEGKPEEHEITLVPISKEAADKLSDKALPSLADAGGGGKPGKTKIGEEFDKASVDETPEGWKNRRLGEGKLAKWQVVEEEGAPSGKNVLAIVEPTNAAGTWNLCIDEDVAFPDDCISSAKIKAESGEAAMGGGLVFNYKDKRNFYAVMLDFKAKEVAMYKVVNGVPELCTLTDGRPAKASVQIARGKWHTLQAERMPSRILVRLDGETKPVLDARDQTFRGGKFGVVAPADAVTKFDSLIAEPPKRPMGG